MNTFDIIVAVPLIWGAYKGYTKGLFLEFTNILAFILGIILAFKFIDVAMELLLKYVGNLGAGLPLIAFLMVFIGVIFGVSFLGKALKKIIDFTLIGSIDDLAGGVLGILKWGIAISLVLWLMQQADVSFPFGDTDDSILYPYLVEFGPLVVNTCSKLLPFAKDLIESITILFEEVK